MNNQVKQMIILFDLCYLIKQKRFKEVGAVGNFKLITILCQYLTLIKHKKDVSVSCTQFVQISWINTNNV